MSVMGDSHSLTHSCSVACGAAVSLHIHAPFSFEKGVFLVGIALFVMHLPCTLDSCSMFVVPMGQYMYILCTLYLIGNIQHVAENNYLTLFLFHCVQSYSL